MNTIPKLVPWIGSKGRLADKILPHFTSHTCYVEPFAGSAALFFLKEPSKSEVLNDVNGDLVNLYRVIKHHLEEFVRQFKWTLVSRENWQWLSNTPAASLTDVQRAARFYYLQRQGFGGRVEHRSFGTSTTNAPKLNLLRLEEDLSMAHLRLAHTTIERLEWSECIRRYDRPHTLFYMDPPYWGTEGYGVEFGLEQYEQMANAMRTIKGAALVSVNDVPRMRETFKGFPIRKLTTRYSVSRTDRQMRSELLIASRTG